MLSVISVIIKVQYIHTRKSHALAVRNETYCTPYGECSFQPRGYLRGNCGCAAFPVRRLPSPLPSFQNLSLSGSHERDMKEFRYHATFPDCVQAVNSTYRRQPAYQPNVTRPCDNTYQLPFLFRLFAGSCTPGLGDGWCDPLRSRRCYVCIECILHSSCRRALIA
ncbi:hypothetical protein BDV41DRAFT_65597 [Aspergillus transmontanensis]|uniref:Uncharacterized protein n=1 Tax=Aspergillus transmontanensis TaxID=1034304 RepID=A0A5N6VG75_9EURO|nr:hypothetical protein BDV41DRAFT_65597 [Aspergillus transmontanensis]